MMWKDVMTNGIFIQFDLVSGVTAPPKFPKAGTTYLYQWGDRFLLYHIQLDDAGYRP